MGMFLSCVLQGQVLKLFVVYKTGETQQNSRNGAFEEGTYIMSAEASSLYELAALPLAFTLSLGLPLLLLLRFPEV